VSVGVTDDDNYRKSIITLLSLFTSRRKYINGFVQCPVSYTTVSSTPFTLVDIFRVGTMSSLTFHLSRARKGVRFWDLLEYLDGGSTGKNSVVYKESMYYIPSGCIIDNTLCQRRQRQPAITRPS
jgi:hypothetical protein